MTSMHERIYDSLSRKVGMLMVLDNRVMPTALMTFMLICKHADKETLITYVATDWIAAYRPERSKEDLERHQTSLLKAGAFELLDPVPGNPYQRFRLRPEYIWEAPLHQHQDEDFPQVFDHEL